MKTTGCIITAIIIVSMLMSCTASTHLGVVTVEKPPMTEMNLERWFLYYQDQFDAFKGKVQMPTDAFPPQALKGYEKAEKEWNEKVSNAHLKNTFGGIVVILIIYSVLDFNIGSIEFSGWR